MSLRRRSSIKFVISLPLVHGDNRKKWSLRSPRQPIPPSRNLELSLKTTPALLFVFRRFDPNYIGIIDYHGANRHYQRERIGGLNVNIDEYQQRFAQHSLFDIQNKYTNIKSELASSYILGNLLLDLMIITPSPIPASSKHCRKCLVYFFRAKLPRTDTVARWNVELSCIDGRRCRARY